MYNPIIIPSKNIYGSPIFDATNNIIENVEAYEDLVAKGNTGDQLIKSFFKFDIGSDFEYDKDSSPFTIKEYKCDVKSSYGADIYDKYITTSYNSSVPYDILYASFSVKFPNDIFNKIKSELTTMLDHYGTVSYKIDGKGDIIKDENGNLVKNEKVLETITIKAPNEQRSPYVVLRDGSILLEQSTGKLGFITILEDHLEFRLEVARAKRIGTSILDFKHEVPFSFTYHSVNCYSPYYEKKTSRYNEEKKIYKLETNEFFQERNVKGSYILNPPSVKAERIPNSYDANVWVELKYPNPSEDNLKFVVVFKYKDGSSKDSGTLLISPNSLTSNKYVLENYYSEDTAPTDVFVGGFPYYPSSIIANGQYFASILVVNYGSPMGVFKQISKYISENIIENYKNGKKTIDLKIGYADYYKLDGSAYGTNGKKKVIEVGEYVIPCQPKFLNDIDNEVHYKDVPMSINPNQSLVETSNEDFTNARVFEVISSEVVLEGVPTINLKLLEKTT